MWFVQVKRRAFTVTSALKSGAAACDAISYRRIIFLSCLYITYNFLFLKTRIDLCISLAETAGNLHWLVQHMTWAVNSFTDNHKTLAAHVSCQMPQCQPPLPRFEPNPGIVRRVSLQWLPPPSSQPWPRHFKIKAQAQQITPGITVVYI